MKILEDFKEILYDILGFVLPGMFAMIIFIPMMIFSNNKTWTSFVTEISKGLIEKRQLGIEVEKTNGIIEIITNESFTNFLSQNKIVITVFFIAMAYLVGCAVHFGAKKYYEIIEEMFKIFGIKEKNKFDEAQKNLLKKEKNNNKFLELTFGENDPYNLSKSIIRYKLRRIDQDSLVGKYIGKYNFFMCFSFVFFVVTSIFVKSMFGLGWAIILIPLHFCLVPLAIKVHKKMKLIIGIIAFLLLVVMRKEYYVVALSYIVHMGLCAEYLRHYNLSKKEAFLGMADYLSK